MRRFDQLLEDALRLAIKATMKNMYKCVHGDGRLQLQYLVCLYKAVKYNCIRCPCRNTAVIAKICYGIAAEGGQTAVLIERHISSRRF